MHDAATRSERCIWSLTSDVPYLKLTWHQLCMHALPMQAPMYVNKRIAENATAHPVEAYSVQVKVMTPIRVIVHRS